MKISLLLSALALTVVLALSGQDGPDLPDGEGKDLVTDRCAGCHGLDRVAAYKGTEEDWGGVVYTMIGRGLVVTPEENEQIVAYLAKNFPPPAKKAAAPLPDGEGKDLVMDRCAGCHDLARVEAHSGTKDDWEGVVKYMISLGLAAKPEEDARIVAYLAKNFPPPAKEGADPDGEGAAKGKGMGKAHEPAKPATPPSDTPAPTQPK
jgi:mono/diheme cytochrome c family protein